MSVRTASLVVAAVLAAVSLHSSRVAAQSPAEAVSAAEVEALKAQLAVLQERLAAIEAAQRAQAVQPAATSAAPSMVDAEQQKAIDRKTDVLAETRAGIGDWVGRF